MATAIGSYCTRALVEAHMGRTLDSTDQTELSLVCDRINQLIEDITGRVLAPITSTTYLYDGDGTATLYLPLPEDKAPIGGIRAVTLVEVKPYTGGSFTTLPSGDYFLRQRVGLTGPFERLVMSDVPTGGYLYFPRGYQTVRVTGTAGWAAIPDTIQELAINTAQRAWNAREVGQQDVSGNDEMGRPIVARYLAGRDRDTLRKYTLVENLV